MTWIKLHRQITEWEWYDDINVYRLFTHLLLTVNYKEAKWRGLSIKEGSRIAGRKVLACETGLTEKQIRTAIKKLKSTKELAIEKTPQGYVYQLVNWREYQSGANERAKEGPSKGQARATIKERKERKEEKEITKAQAIQMFEEFRKEYPGTKRGSDQEFENFQKKFDLEIVNELLPALKSQIETRKRLAAADQFVPEWPHLKTWINQERWTEETPIAQPKKATNVW